MMMPSLGIYLLKASLLFLWRFESPQVLFFLPRMVQDFLRCKQFPSERDVNVPKLSYCGLRRTYPLHQAAKEKKWRIMLCLMNFGANPQQILGLRFLVAIDFCAQNLGDLVAICATNPCFLFRVGTVVTGGFGKQFPNMNMTC